MSHIPLRLTTAILSAAIAFSPVPLMATPNVLPGESAEHLPKLSPETIAKRKKRAEAREEARAQRRLQRQKQKSKQSN